MEQNRRTKHRYFLNEKYLAFYKQNIQTKQIFVLLSLHQNDMTNTVLTIPN